MMLMSGMDFPVKAVRNQISSAIDVVLQPSRIFDGSRKITYISEIQGMEGDTIVFPVRVGQNRRKGGSIGHFESTGVQPIFLDNHCVKE